MDRPIDRPGERPRLRLVCLPQTRRPAAVAEPDRAVTRAEFEAWCETVRADVLTTIRDTIREVRGRALDARHARDDAIVALLREEFRRVLRPLEARAARLESVLGRRTGRPPAQPPRAPSDAIPRALDDLLGPLKKDPPER